MNSVHLVQSFRFDALFVFVCMRFVSSPSVQLASDIPRSVKSLSVNMTGGLRFPVPMGSSLK